MAWRVVLEGHAVLPHGFEHEIAVGAKPSARVLERVLVVANLHVGMCVDMRVDMCADMYVDMCAEIRLDICRPRASHPWETDRRNGQDKSPATPRPRVAGHCSPMARLSMICRQRDIESRSAPSQVLGGA